MKLLYMFQSTQDKIGKGFKYTWFRVKPNYLMPFIAYITNEENEEDDSDIGMFEVQV